MFPDIIMRSGLYASPVWHMACESVGCLVYVDGDEMAIWSPDPVPAIGAAALDLIGCLDADHTQ